MKASTLPPRDERQADVALREAARLRVLASEARQLGLRHLAAALNESAEGAYAWAASWQPA